MAYASWKPQRAFLVPRDVCTESTLESLSELSQFSEVMPPTATSYCCFAPRDFPQSPESNLGSTFNKEKVYKTRNPVVGVAFGYFPEISSVTCVCV